MSFQGFAREEGFSTHQINIDIGSVIDNDLAEATRMSKFMAKNADLEQKWGNMYLNAMINKHEEEKRNRDWNHKFFMDNRKEIQKQIQYNNQIKLQDAKRVEPAPLSETITPILFDFAVKAGSIVIQKEMAKRKEEKAKKEEQERQQILDAAENIGRQASPEQKAFIKSGGFGKTYSEKSAEQQKEIRTKYNLLGKHKVGEINAAYVHKTNGLDVVDRQNNMHSVRNSNLHYTQHLTNFTTEINGQELTVGQVVGLPYNSETRNEFFARAQASYQQQVGYSKLVPSAKNNISDAFISVEGEYRQHAHNNEFKQSIRDRENQFYSGIEAVQSVPEKLDYVFSIQGPGGQFGNNYGWEWLAKAADNGAFTANQIREIKAWKHGPSGESINDGSRNNTAKYRLWSQLEAKAVATEQLGFQNQQAVINLEATKLLHQIPSMDPQQARSTLESMTIEGSNLNDAVKMMSTQQRSQLQTALAEQAGILPPREGDPAWEAASEIFLKPFQDEAIEQVLLDNLDDVANINEAAKTATQSISDIPKIQARTALKSWLRNEVAGLHKQGIEDEESILRHVTTVLGEKGSTSYKRLKDLLRVEITKGDAGNIYRFPALEIYDVGKATGVSEYRQLTGSALLHGKELNLQEVYQTPAINNAMEPLLRRLKQAQDNNLDVQHIISNHGTPFIKQRLRSMNNGSVGQIINEAIKNGNYGMDYTPLAESDYMNATEVQEIRNKYGAPFTRSLQSLQSSVLQNGFNSASHVRPGDASIVAELDYRHAGHGLYNPDNAHGDWNIKVKGGTQRDHNDATNFLYDVLNGLGIVATEVLERDGVGNMHVPGSEHYLGNKMDVPFRGQTYSLSGPTTDADRSLYHKNRKLADTILSLYNQGNTDPNQVIKMIKGEQQASSTTPGIWTLNDWLALGRGGN